MRRRASNTSRSKAKTIIGSIITLVLIGVIVYAVLVYYGMFGLGCREVIGDGYYMGTDEEPVVIGQVCNGVFLSQ